MVGATRVAGMPEVARAAAAARCSKGDWVGDREGKATEVTNQWAGNIDTARKGVFKRTAQRARCHVKVVNNNCDYRDQNFSRPNYLWSLTTNPEAASNMIPVMTFIASGFLFHPFPA